MALKWNNTSVAWFKRISTPLEADCLPASKEIPPPFTELEGSLPRSQKPANELHLQPDVIQSTVSNPTPFKIHFNIILPHNATSTE